MSSTGPSSVSRKPIGGLISKAYSCPTENTYHDSALFDVTGSRRGEVKPGLHHFAFELENEIDLVEGYKRIGELGFEFDHNLSADVAHCCYGHDPEGNRFEVYADVKPNWREERTGTIETGASKSGLRAGRNPTCRRTVLSRRSRNS